MRHVARELHNRLSGLRAHALQLDRERLTIVLRCGSITLGWDLSAGRGNLHIVSATERLHGNVQLPRPGVVSDVSAGPDERVLTIRFDTDPSIEHQAPAGATSSLVVELIPPAWNAVAVGVDGRITAVLRPRSGGARPLASGRAYEPPRRTARAGATTPISTGEWRRILRDVPPAERPRALLANVAYTSPINSAHILGVTAGLEHAPPNSSASEGGVTRRDDDRALDDALARYRRLTAPDAVSPCVLRTPHGVQPYPFALDDMASESQPTLLDAFDAAAGASGAPPIEVTATPADRAIALERVRRRQHRLDGRIARLRAELEGAAADAPALRRQADLLLAQLGRARRGDRAVTLDDFAGGTIVVELDPTLSPADNAQRLYDAARKRERAAQRLPAMLRSAEAEAARLNELAERIQAGTAKPTEPESVAPTTRARDPQRVEPRLPYRRYRTSSGLEVRVGRSARDSDELTLRLSSPNDIWLHARQVAGAHVVLRWADRDTNPSGADLREAAILAAVHSKARSSATVPVDWTRRKYVRKPRKAKPGLVAIERAKTLFVEPSESLERRLRE